MKTNKIAIFAASSITAELLGKFKKSYPKTDVSNIVDLGNLPPGSVYVSLAGYNSADDIENQITGLYEIEGKSKSKDGYLTVKLLDRIEGKDEPSDFEEMYPDFKVGSKVIIDSDSFNQDVFLQPMDTKKLK